MPKRLILFLMAAISILAARAEVVYSDATTRFTLITPGAIRMEYAPDGGFVDDPSFVAVNREFPKVDAKVQVKGKTLLITTPKMRLTYKIGSGAFTANNLTIESGATLKRKFSWHPGMQQKQNLKGTYRTLDGYDGSYSPYYKKDLPMEDGLIARDGWTLIDDSSALLFDDADWAWVKERKQAPGSQDLIFLAYGNDYKAALRDFTAVAGKVPLPPRYAFGFWWSRYWCYTDNELRDLIASFKNYDIPLDVLVIDMDWHYTEKGKGGWTGYTWNRDLFPDPEGLLKHIADNDLHITMNLHPASGIAAYEENYAPVARRMGVDPASKETIPFEASNKEFMSAWLDEVLRPNEKAGVDFWWLDWQQWANDKKIPDLSNTWWLNYSFFTDMERHRQTRPMLYHRWGGLGNHRYQIGFSGDTYITWNSLAFQPYFNSTASNVLYGYWSHDIGGHYGGVGRVEPEMYTRWMQFGALSPVLRVHSTKDAALTKEPWVQGPEHFKTLRNIIRQRYEMSPYIYTMARRNYDDALPLCRPLYYDYPDAEQAYDFKNQYMFGDELLVAPIVAPMDSTLGFSELEVWLPGGNDWYEIQTGTLLSGDTLASRRFTLDEYPLYAKAGSIVPRTSGLHNLRTNSAPLIVDIYPGASASFSLYEDNGNDKNYATDFARTPLDMTFDGRTMRVGIGARTGSYPDMPAKRDYSVRLNMMAPPASVTVDGRPAKYDYDGNALTVSIPMGKIDCSVPHTVEIAFAEGSEPVVADGTQARFKRLQTAFADLKQHNAGIEMKEDFAILESTGRRLTYRPQDWTEAMTRFRDSWQRLPELLAEPAYKLDDDAQTRFLRLAAHPAAK